MSPRTGRVAAYKWLILRRLAQASVLGLFLLGPLAGIWIIKGSLGSSLTLDVLPLADPYMLVQSLFAGHVSGSDALMGAAVAIVFFAVVGGRVYCSWVCPINVVTDAARWTRRRFVIGGGVRFPRSARYWVLAMTLIVSLATGTLAWELVNPVTMVFRGLVFGMGLAWVVILAVFLLDLFVGGRAWCGHLCPVGAFYSIVGRISLLRVSAPGRASCDDCMDCFAVCPEPQVITPALKGADKGIGPLILSPNCTNCGRCIDVCHADVFGFASRFNQNSKDAPAMKEAA